MNFCLILYQLLVGYKLITRFVLNNAIFRGAHNLFDTVDRESCSAFHIVYNRQVVLFQSNRKSKYSASNKWMSNRIEFKKMKSHKRKK